MTLGNKRVRTDFNVSGNPSISEIKMRMAHFIDYVDDLDSTGNGEIARLKALAITNAELASMWAVKAFTEVEYTDRYEEVYT